MAKTYVPTTLDQYIAESLDEGLFDKENFKKIGSAIKQGVGILTDEQAKAKGMQIVKNHPAKLAAYNSWKTRRPDVAEKLLIYVGNHPNEPYFTWDGKKWLSTGVKSSASGLQGPSSGEGDQKVGKYDKNGDPIKESAGQKKPLNEAARMGSSSWKAILQDLEDYESGPGYGWDVNMKARTATQYYSKSEVMSNDEDYDEDSDETLAEDDDRKLVLSCPSYNYYILVQILDGDDNVLDETEWDAEGLSAGEISMDAFREVDYKL